MSSASNWVSLILPYYFTLKCSIVVHDIMMLIGFNVNVFVGSSLIKLYAENGCIEDAQHLFGEMPKKDCVLWNIMLSGFIGVYFSGVKL